MTEHLVKAICDDVGLRRESVVDSSSLPMWLARLHRSIPAGSIVELSIKGILPISAEHLIEGAGFVGTGPEFTRERTLPDFVGPGMKALICGLNPSLNAADAGVGFVTSSNRFWPAAQSAGIISSDRNPSEALADDRVGFTDLVKRATPRAGEITKAEFRAGVTRLERLTKWLEPKAIVMVGLTGWRGGRDRAANAGWQDETLGGRPIYLMPNTSGINTHVTLEGLTEHFRSVLSGPPAARTTKS